MYGKIFKQIYKGTLAMVGPWQALVTFQQMIILADQDGVVDMTPDALSRETTIPLDIITKGLEALSQPDPESRTPDEEGRRIVLLSDSRSWGWRIVNYDHYRKLQTDEERRAYHRRYYREKRSKSATNGALNNSQTDSTDSRQVEVEVKAKVKKNIGAKRAPKDFAITMEMYAWAESECGILADEVQQETEIFKDHEFAKPRKDWQAVWRNWMRRAAKWRKDEKAKRGDSFDAIHARTRKAAGLD